MARLRERTLSRIRGLGAYFGFSIGGSGGGPFWTYILLENLDYILQEDNSKIRKES